MNYKISIVIGLLIGAALAGAQTYIGSSSSIPGLYVTSNYTGNVTAPEGVTAANLPDAIMQAALAQIEDLMTSEPPVEPTPEPEA